MRVLPPHPEIMDFLHVHRLEKRFAKQKSLFEQNPFHPSLGTELLEPRKMRIWSFRVDRRYRAIFIFKARDVVEVLDVNNHYQRT